MQDDRSELLTDSEMAAHLRVRVSWLRDEAKAGRLPCVDAGRRLLFNRSAVEAVLTERATHIKKTQRRLRHTPFEFAPFELA